MKLDLNTSPAKSLFLGQIVEENLFPFPKLTKEEAETVRIVVDSIDKFMTERTEDFQKFDEKGEQPTEYIQKLRELGLFSLIIPEELGGLGFSNSAYARVLQQTSRHDAATSLTIGAHSSIGMKGLLLFGTEEQKTKYLPRLATGEMIAAFCLTEPGAGSDAASLSTKAEKNADGTWTLNGEKIWITNGGIAEFFTVFARTDTEKGKLSAFIVEKSFPGVTVGTKEDKLGIRASSTTTVSFENVILPANTLLGEEGKGFKIAMSILNNGRTGLGGGCIGGMKRCIELAANQAAERKQFGQPIASFGLVQKKIAQMTVNCFATESVVSMVGHYIDSGLKDYSIEAAISKVFASEAMWETANEALQIAGGNGFMKEYPYEKYMRDCRINMIFEGTNEILRLYIALSGLKDAGDYLKDIAKNLSNIFNDPIKGFGVFSDYATKKLSQVTPIGREKINFVHLCLREEAQVFETAANQVEVVCETVLRRHKKDIVNKQFALARIANCIIDLFVGLCVLSRASTIIEEKSREKSAQEINIAKTFIAQAKRRIEQNIKDVERNEDEWMKEISNTVVTDKGYPWDTL